MIYNTQYILEECCCSCHDNNDMKHCFPCCNKCPYCERNIIIGFYHKHKEICKEKENENG